MEGESNRPHGVVVVVSCRVDVVIINKYEMKKIPHLGVKTKSAQAAVARGAAELQHKTLQ